MPRYEFSCPACGQVFERVLPINRNQSKVRCPTGHRGVRRVYAAPSVVFKGNGYYVTDHRPKPPTDSGSGK